MKYLYKLNEYNDLSGGDWEEVESEEYWSGIKSAVSFTKSELNLIQGICDKNHLQLIDIKIVNKIRIERPGGWVIIVVKDEDEWFYIVTASQLQLYSSFTVDKYYKADQIDGLISFLKEMDIKYDRLMNEILDYLDKMKAQYIENGHDDDRALDIAYNSVKLKYGMGTYRKFVNWIETR